jgi:hypothetical protein
MLIRVCVVAVAALLSAPGFSFAADSKPGDKPEGPSATGKGQGCHDRLPPELRAQLEEHASWLSRELTSCVRIPDPEWCRNRAKTEFGTRTQGTLADIQKVYGGEVRDCVGDTKESTAANCPQGSEVQKVTVPCLHCVGAYGTTAGGTCFVWVCVPQGL